MATGISGSNSGQTLDGYQDGTLAIVELRTISQLLQNLLGTNQAADDLKQVRQDQAFDLGILTPIPGN